jgi:probable rRNA maturation factor
MSELSVRNRQRARPVDLSSLRRMARTLLLELLGIRDYELGVYLVDAEEMARLNRQFLNHAGSTDVITFDYAPDGLAIRTPQPGTSICGEIFICVDDAVKQARQFRTTRQAELARYLVHGVLHLLGHDDLQSGARRAMKREEARLLRALEKRFPLRHTSRKSSGAGVKIRNCKSTIRNPRRRFPLSLRPRKPRVPS